MYDGLEVYIAVFLLSGAGTFYRSKRVRRTFNETGERTVKLLCVMVPSLAN